MKKFVRGAAVFASLVLAAGSSVAQPAVNGRLKPEYGPIQWSNSTATQFGNSGPATAPPCDPIGGGVKITLNNSNRAGVAGPGTPVTADQMAAAAVATGYELKIPLETLGFDITSGGANLPGTVTVRVAGVITSDNYGGVSNQFLGGVAQTGAINGFPGPSPRTIDLTTIANDQFITASIAKATLLALASGNEPALDGTRDASYGAALFVQDTTTSYGDATSPSGAGDSIFRALGGSEIDGASARFGRDGAGELALYVMITGNFESNFRKLSLFFDSKAGGQNQLTSDSATQTGTFGSIFGGGANAFGGDGTQPGLRFDAGFGADYFLGFSNGGSGDQSPTLYADWQRLRTSPTDAGSARFIGGTTATQNGGILTASDPCPPFVEPNYADVAGGSEINGLYAMVCGDYLYVLVTGNLENNGNRLDLFFDVGRVTVPLASTGEGQTRLLGNSHPFDFGHLNRLGRDAADPTNLPGLQFSSGFAADYWASMENTGTSSVNVQTYAAMINVNGANNDAGFPNAAYLEYGGIAGGPKSANNPLVFDGQKCIRFDAMNNCAPNGAGSAFNPMSIPGLDIQGDATANGLPLITEPYTSFGPRLASRDVSNPLGITVSGFPAPAHGNYTVPGLLSTSIDNSNFGGVSDTSAAGARQVGTGMEVRVRLDELGYGGSGPIRVAGFIVSQDHSFVSNQVIGGTLAVSQGNFGEPRVLDFQSAALAPAGPFYVTIDPGTCATVAAGACCFAANSCTLMSSAQCGAAAGTFNAGTTCNPSPCGGGGTGICCRGATCSTAFTSAAACGATLVGGQLAGAAFVAGTACNSGPLSNSPCCYANYNKVSGITVQDIFDFLGDWFAGSRYANTGGNGNPATLSVQNIFDFLSDWFAGGCS